MRNKFLLACGLTGIFLIPRAEAASRLVLLYVSDLHGRLRAETAPNFEAPGYARVSGWIHAEKSRADGSTDVIALFGGDAVGKSALPCRRTNESACIGLFKDMGFDAAVLGNNELKLGPAGVKALIVNSGIPWVSANVAPRKIRGRSAGLPAWEPNRILKGPKTGVEVVWTGWTISPLPGEVKPADEAFDVRPEPSAADFDAWKQAATAGRVLIVGGHDRWENDLELMKRACEAGVKPGLMFQGHTHMDRRQDESLCAPVVEPGKYGSVGAKVVFEKDGDTWKLKSKEFVAIDDKVEADSALQAKVDELYRKQGTDADKVVVKVGKALDYPGTAQYVADAYRKVSAADVAIVNIGAVKAPLDAGSLTMEREGMTFAGEHELMGADVSYTELSKALCAAAARSRDPMEDVSSDLFISGGHLVDSGGAGCKLELDRRMGRVKVVIDEWMLRRSKRWLGLDLNGRAFRFGFNTERALLRSFELKGGAL